MSEVVCGRNYMDLSSHLQMFHILLLFTLTIGSPSYPFSARLGDNGYSITEDAGTITSPKYPDQYPANDEEEWDITLSFTQEVVFSFVVIDFEAGDEVIIAAGGVNETFPKASQDRTWISNPISSFTVYFRSGSTRGAGFILNYESELLAQTVSR